jgi:hypothetical protein
MDLPLLSLSTSTWCEPSLEPARAPSDPACARLRLHASRPYAGGAVLSKELFDFFDDMAWVKGKIAATLNLGLSDESHLCITNLNVEAVIPEAGHIQLELAVSNVQKFAQASSRYAFGESHKVVDNLFPDAMRVTVTVKIQVTDREAVNERIKGKKLVVMMGDVFIAGDDKIKRSRFDTALEFWAKVAAKVVPASGLVVMEIVVMMGDVFIAGDDKIQRSRFDAALEFWGKVAAKVVPASGLVVMEKDEEKSGCGNDTPGAQHWLFQTYRSPQEQARALIVEYEAIVKKLGKGANADTIAALESDFGLV